MKMLLTGGGTGGHLFPAVALAEQLKHEEPDSEVLFVGTTRGLEYRLLPQLGWPLETVDMSGWAGLGPIERLRALVKMQRGVRQAMQILKKFKPDVVVGVGGYASVPVLLAAKLSGLPYLIHEQNAWPGLANRLLGRWARRVCLSFAEADRAYHHGATVLTGNPLRSGMEECPEMPDDALQLLVFGGSLGARAINRTMIDALPYLQEWQDTLQILHQTGEADFETVQQGYQGEGWSGVEVKPFINDMVAAYTRSNLVVCRAGATTIAELTASGRPAILIPFPHAAGGHQSLNAQALAEKGAALLVEERDLTPERLARMISDLLHDQARLKSMASAARSLARGGAAKRMLRECRRVLAEAA